MNQATETRAKVKGTGAFSAPAGLTPEDCERLAREADAARGDA